MAARSGNAALETRNYLGATIWYGIAAGEIGLSVGTLGESAVVIGSVRIAARGIGESTTLYRAVGTRELADIQALRRYRVPPGGTEGKVFLQDARAGI